tara:strand:- start:62 stop:523 length:462 start_codon:yes stop_codon:yes gene_type:complete
MTKKELKVEIPGKVYPRDFEWIKNKGYSFGRIRVPGGWLFTDGLGLYPSLCSSSMSSFHNGAIVRGKCCTCTKKNTGFMFIPDPNHEWVLEPLKEEPEEETSEVMKELHKKTDKALEDVRKYKLTRELKRNPEKTKKKTNKPWFSRLFRTNND